LLSIKIKIVQCDGGTEFKPVMRQNPDITFQVSCPHTPEQNGLAERKHRHIVELGLANLFHASIPLSYWDVIFESTVFVINRLPTSVLGSKSPFEVLFKQAPDYNLLHTLGCACFPLLRPYNNNKLQPRSEKCIFMGYSTIHKGYLCLKPEDDKIIVSRHVTFVEHDLPFTYAHQTTQQDHVSVPSTTTIIVIPPAHQLNQVVNNTDNSSSDDSSSPTTSTHTTNSTPQPQPSTSHTMTTRTKTNSLRPKKFPDHQVYTAGQDSILEEPTCFTQAVKFPVWRQAMTEELSALAQNSTWELVPPPPDVHLIGAKWLFKIKYNADGTVQRHKARLVAKGYSQQEGIDYFETFSPVIKPATIRIVLTIALSQHWPIQQLDVNNAFLHGDLQEVVYMEQPPGFSDPNKPHYVCKLKKALYGLKQAPRAWFFKLKSFLLSLQFKSSEADHSLFIFTDNKVIIYILVYVDDILVTGNNTGAIQVLLKKLQQKFSIKNLGKLNYFLGIETTYCKETMHLSQTRYLQTIIQRANMSNAKPIQTPIETGTQLSRYAGTKMDNPHLYRSVVGALQYATITRLDLSFAVNKASQYLAEPTDLHWQLVKRILRYIQGTLHHGLTFVSTPQLSLHAYCDADWAGCPDDRRSTSGFAIYLGSNLVSWASKKQPTVARSSTEAEYRCLAVTASELTWISSLLKELKLPVSQPPTLWCDNLGATFLASNPIYHARMKHIELDYHFVREKVVSRQLIVKFICSADQLADLMTKGLPKDRFGMIRNKLHVLHNPSRLRGGVEEADDKTLDKTSSNKTGDTA
jgi:Reverse transcriptase (RNA-dependent DNA polymerase)